MTPEHEQAANLLGIIWKGIPADYKSRYRRSIWQQFEDNIRSAAYTSNLGKFVNSLCSKLSAQIGSSGEDRTRADEILQKADAKAMLKLLREETTLLVLMVRVANQERHAARKKERQLQREGEMDSVFEDDIERIISVAGKHNIMIEPEAAHDIWGEISSGWAAGWLDLPQDDDDLWEMMRPYLRKGGR